MVTLDEAYIVKKLQEFVLASLESLK